LVYLERNVDESVEELDLLRVESWPTPHLRESTTVSFVSLPDLSMQSRSEMISSQH